MRAHVSRVILWSHARPPSAPFFIGLSDPESRDFQEFLQGSSPEYLYNMAKVHVKLMSGLWRQYIYILLIGWFGRSAQLRNSVHLYSVPTLTSRQYIDCTCSDLQVITVYSIRLQRHQQTSRPSNVQNILVLKDAQLSLMLGAPYFTFWTMPTSRSSFTTIIDAQDHERLEFTYRYVGAQTGRSISGYCIASRRILGAKGTVNYLSIEGGYDRPVLRKHGGRRLVRQSICSFQQLSNAERMHVCAKSGKDTSATAKMYSGDAQTKPDVDRADAEVVSVRPALYVSLSVCTWYVDIASAAVRGMGLEVGILSVTMIMDGYLLSRHNLGSRKMRRTELFRMASDSQTPGWDVRLVRQGRH
ncbi:hypothetical protein Tco_1285628 [Tanacetum coccineum]